MNTRKTGSPEEIAMAKFKILQCESVLAKARAAVVSAEVDLKVAEARLAKLLTPLPPLSPLAEKTLSALMRLTKERVPHTCGGFTSDDMQWQMGSLFADIPEALGELEASRLIRYAGHDDEDAIGTCYELTEAFEAEIAEARK